jgi:flagellar motor switch protein FliM
MKDSTNQGQDANSSSTNSKVGIKAFLDQALQSYERLPMLEIVFDKFIRQLTTSLRNLTSESVNVEIVEFNSLRFGTYFDTIKAPSSIVVFKAIEWENLGLLVLNSNLIFTFVDVLLGGKNTTAQATATQNASPRVLTAIEQGIARQIVDLFLGELSVAFDSVSPTTFSFERLENNPNFATIARPGDAVIVLKLRVAIDDKGENIDLVIPHKTIEPVKEQMQQVFLGDKFGVDSAWEEAMINSMYNVDLSLEAVIVNRPSKLHEVANLKIGDTILMDHKQEEDVIIRSGQIGLFKGQIGKVESNVAVSLKDIIEKE